MNDRDGGRRRDRCQRLFVEPMLKYGFDASVRNGARMKSAFARGFDSGSWIMLAQIYNAGAAPAFFFRISFTV
jgi:hypothetical protein